MHYITEYKNIESLLYNYYNYTKAADSNDSSDGIGSRRRVFYIDRNDGDIIPIELIIYGDEFIYEIIIFHKGYSLINIRNGSYSIQVDSEYLYKLPTNIESIGIINYLLEAIYNISKDASVVYKRNKFIKKLFDD